MKQWSRSLTRAVSAGVIACALWLAAQSPGSAAPPAGDATAIRALLERSAAAWNRADLAAFMQSYEDSPQTLYIGSHSLVHGYANIRARYLSAYHGAMGTLSFSDMSIRLLGADYAVAVARWHLVLPSGRKPSGLFSLVLHRSDAGWHIITDHSP